MSRRLSRGTDTLAPTRHDGEWQQSGTCDVVLLRRLRGDSRRLLGVLGGLMTLLVIAAGLRRRAILPVAPKTDLPVISVILYGFAFAALLGLFYAAASNAIEARAAVLVDRYAPQPAPDAEDLPAALERRDG